MITTTTTTTITEPAPPGAQRDHAAQALYGYLIEHVLCAVNCGEAQVTRDIERFGRSLRFEQGCLHFTLPDLFAFAVARYAVPEVREIDYKTFRRLLYGQPTNALLQQRGCRVEVARPNAEHALSVYRLVQK